MAVPRCARTTTSPPSSRSSCSNCPPARTLPFRAGGYIQIECPPHQSSSTRTSRSTTSTGRTGTSSTSGSYVSKVDRAGSQRAYSYGELARRGEGHHHAQRAGRLAAAARAGRERLRGRCRPTSSASSQGDEVTISGPFGEFFAKDTDAEMVFIGGGAGMAPMRSHIFDLSSTGLNTDRKVSVLVRRTQSLQARPSTIDRLRFQIAAENDNFEWHLALSDPLPEDEWNGMTGFIHQVLLRPLPEGPSGAGGLRVLHLRAAADARRRAMKMLDEPGRGAGEHPLRRLRLGLLRRGRIVAIQRTDRRRPRFSRITRRTGVRLWRSALRCLRSGVGLPRSRSRRPAAERCSRRADRVQPRPRRLRGFDTRAWESLSPGRRWGTTWSVRLGAEGWPEAEGLSVLAARGSRGSLEAVERGDGRRGGRTRSCRGSTRCADDRSRSRSRRRCCSPSCAEAVRVELSERTGGRVRPSTVGPLVNAPRFRCSSDPAAVPSRLPKQLEALRDAHRTRSQLELDPEAHSLDL